MSDLTPRPPDDRLAFRPDRESFKAIIARPFQLLPAEVRPAALRVWTCHRHLTGLETGLSITALVSVWIDEYGLTPADACDCLSSMLSPERVGAHKFASDLTTTLAGLVSARLKQRRQEAEAEARRCDHEEGERTRAERPDGFSLTRLIEGFGSDGTAFADREGETARPA